MRIISGKYRGKQLYPPKTLRARPTTDFAREGLFNILLNQFDPEEIEVLDLFAGTGSITFEFASRGAGSVVSVESDPVHHRFISRTCNELGFDRVTAIRGDAFGYLHKPVQPFDVVFADPPYDHARIPELPDLVFAVPLLNTGGRFILEHPSVHTFTAHPRFLHHRKYGSVNFSFFG